MPVESDESQGNLASMLQNLHVSVMLTTRPFWKQFLSMTGMRTGRRTKRQWRKSKQTLLLQGSSSFETITQTRSAGNPNSRVGLAHRSSRAMLLFPRIDRRQSKVGFAFSQTVLFRVFGLMIMSYARARRTSGEQSHKNYSETHSDFSLELKGTE